ncbi:MAG: sulfite exporter TauE/SafE family protein [Chloroflexi bacterium]|nr:sulfite exporter TauE/SafE family protein [Chloroflexota bacterium]
MAVEAAQLGAGVTSATAGQPGATGMGTGSFERPRSRPRRVEARRPRPVWRRTLRAWRSWLPLTIALALAAAGAVALAVSAWHALAPSVVPALAPALNLAAARQDQAPAAAVQLAGGPAAPLQTTLALTRALTRSARAAGGQDVDVLYATPGYFQRSGQQALATRYGQDRYLLFFVTETIHTDELQPPLQPVLSAGGRLVPSEPPLVLMDAVHHRTSVVRFPKVDAAGRPLLDDGVGSFEVLLPAGERGGAAALRWELPIVEAQADTGRQPLAVGSVLALLGGLLAAMWPCLFQLTAYFIPSIAGLSMANANEPAGAAVRARVVRTALLFVIGIVLVYTLAGAAAGYAVQTPGARSLFETWRRPLSIAGALLIGAMAVRMALRARAPMACQMPMFSPLERLGRSPLGTMLLGVAFATGCMTCFGAAITLGMFTYVASTGSVLMGAGTLLIFSLGFAVPLVVGSIFMARVLPLLDRLQRLVPALTLASSAVMLGFAVLLLTDRYHVVSDALARLALGG